MNCAHCKSHNLVKFVDGFGNNRFFCRSCGRSFLDCIKILPDGQKTLLKFESGIYHRPGFVPMSR